MSKRSGDFVTLREVVDEVGSDAVRFMMLFRKKMRCWIDLAKVIEQSRQRGVYVQYGTPAATRCFVTPGVVLTCRRRTAPGRRSRGGCGWSG